MIRLIPVEAAAVDDEYLLLTKQIECKLFIVCNVEPCSFNLWGYVKCCLLLSCRNLLAYTLIAA